MNYKNIDEERHFQSTLQLIHENRTSLALQISQLKERINQLGRLPDKDTKESRNLLMVSQNQLEQLNRSLKKHEAAMDKPYFGRIDYDDLHEQSYETLYIGKNGIARQQNILIVDWRAPAASVYYENEPGEGSYNVPGADQVPINLYLKRTYNVSGGQLLGYYDNDIASNDQLLVSYLSRNKEAALDDIIATIQREQNLIIRQPPFKNMLIQGVAGSGKTTVILHHLSYVLYNYNRYVHPEECCIIGGSKMLLSYIASGLPELDVDHIQAWTMEDLLTSLLDRNWKKKYRLVPPGKDCIKKSRIPFIQALSTYIDSIRARLLSPATISDCQLGILLSDTNQAGTIELNPTKSVAQIAALINSRILSQLESILMDDRELLKKKKGQYRNFWSPLDQCPSITDLYTDFLIQYMKDGEMFSETLDSIAQNCFDIYDLAALVYLYRRLAAKKDFDQYRLILIDEAQDFGESLYYVLAKSLDNCRFVLTGDISQNINYDTGLNSWDTMKEIFLNGEKDSFHLLLKSYRNTIEISRLASRILKKTAAKDYAIQPVIRHGMEAVWITDRKEQLPVQCAALIRKALEQGYHTIAVICLSQKQTVQVKSALQKQGILPADEEEGFSNGVLVLPVMLSKGLEFDVVILWEPDKEHYPSDPRHANLLYVAATRALHELYLLGTPDWSSLLDD